MAKYFWRKLALMRYLETKYTLLLFIVLVVGGCVIHGDTVCTEGSELDGAWPQSQPSHPLWVMGSLLGLSRPISKMTHIIFRCWRTVTSKAWTFREWQRGWYSAAAVVVTGVVGDVALVGVAVGIGVVVCYWYGWCCLVDVDGIDGVVGGDAPPLSDQASFLSLAASNGRAKTSWSFCLSLEGG